MSNKLTWARIFMQCQDVRNIEPWLVVHWETWTIRCAAGHPDPFSDELRQPRIGLLHRETSLNIHFPILESRNEITTLETWLSVFQLSGSTTRLAYAQKHRPSVHALCTYVHSLTDLLAWVEIFLPFFPEFHGNGNIILLHSRIELRNIVE